MGNSLRRQRILDSHEPRFTHIVDGLGLWEIYGVLRCKCREGCAVICILVRLMAPLLQRGLLAGRQRVELVRSTFAALWKPDKDLKYLRYF